MSSTCCSPFGLARSGTKTVAVPLFCSVAAETQLSGVRCTAGLKNSLATSGRMVLSATRSCSCGASVRPPVQDSARLVLPWSTALGASEVMRSGSSLAL